MMRSCCGNTQLMPYGMGGSNPSYSCLGPCKNQPCNIKMTNPVCEFPIPPWPQKDCPSPPAPIPQSCLSPINVNLQMCKQDPKESCGDYKEAWRQYVSGEACNKFCNFDFEERPKRCPEGNFVEKVGLIKPDLAYQPSRAAFDGRTMYKTSFVPKEIEKVNLYRPKKALLNLKGDFDDVSLYKLEYVRHPIAPYERPPWARAEDFQPPHGAMPSSTTYNSAFTGSPGDPAESVKKHTPFNPNNRQPLDDRTTHKVDYVPHCVERQKGFGPDQEENMRLCHCVPFRGETTYKVDFTPKSGGTRKSFRPRGVPPRNQKMSSLTTYQIAYEPFYFTKVCEPCIPPNVYDQLYPRHPCQCVQCCEPITRDEGPPQRPSPPCPMPDTTCPCPPSSFNGCEPQPVCQLPFKLKIENENNKYEPTVIHVEPNPAVPRCTNFV